MNVSDEKKFSVRCGSDLERRLVGLWLIGCALTMAGVILWAVLS